MQHDVWLCRGVHYAFALGHTNINIYMYINININTQMSTLSRMHQIVCFWKQIVKSYYSNLVHNTDCVIIMCSCTEIILNILLLFIYFMIIWKNNLYSLML